MRQTTDATRVDVNLRAFLRYLAGLLNMCPHWVASPTPDGGHTLARSPTGLCYLLQVVPDCRLDAARLEAVAAAQSRHRADRAVLIGVSGAYGPRALELARARGVQLWTLEQVDYLVMAADLESNAPLAYVGLEVAQPRVTHSTHPPALRHATQGV